MPVGRARASLLGLAALAAAGGAQARAPYEGVWSEKAEWCRTPPASTGDYPVRIDRRGWSGYEFWCDFRRIRRQGNRWTIEADCGGESETETATIRLRRTGPDLWISTPQGEMRRHVRCAICDRPGRAERYPCRPVPEVKR